VENSNQVDQVEPEKRLYIALLEPDVVDRLLELDPDRKSLSAALERADMLLQDNGLYEFVHENKAMRGASH
jgi:hypothetical protein